MYNVSNSNSTFKPHILGRHSNKALSFIPTTTYMDPTSSPKGAGFSAELWLLVFEDVYSGNPAVVSQHFNGLITPITYRDVTLNDNLVEYFKEKRSLDSMLP